MIDKENTMCYHIENFKKTCLFVRRNKEVLESIDQP